MYSDLILKFTGFLLPLFLIGTTIMVFNFFGKHFGSRSGYILGLLFYWIFWCAALPMLIMNPSEIKSLYSLNASFFNESKFINVICLILPVVLAYGYAFPRRFKKITIKIIVLSLLLAIINATMEELFWRGLFLKLFGSDKWIYVFYSSFGFAVWHFVPQNLIPEREMGGQVTFAAFAFVLGVLLSLVSYNTNSILLVTLCHILFDFSGFGVRIYSSESLSVPVLNENRLKESIPDKLGVRNRF
jgi:uncharacterized protein